jgi:hypothetical protein
MEQENELMERHVRQLGQQWAATALHGDTPVLERTPADDVVGIRPRGLLLPKEQWLAEYRSGGRTTLKIVGTHAAAGACCIGSGLPERSCTVLHRGAFPRGAKGGVVGEQEHLLVHR